METILTILFIILFFYILSKGPEWELKPKDDTEDIDNEINYKDKPKEEMFYHPVTGYKGTKSEMDAYICNRERGLKK